MSRSRFAASPINCTKVWVLLEGTILALGLLLNDRSNPAAVIYSHNYGLDAAGFILVSIAAAWMVLGSSIPGCETNATELMLLTIGSVAATLMVQFEPLSRTPLSPNDFLPTLTRQLSFAALPYVALFWSARRATPLRPLLTGGMIGVAASSFAIGRRSLQWSGLSDRLGTPGRGDPYDVIGYRRRSVARSRTVMAQTSCFVGPSAGVSIGPLPSRSSGLIDPAVTIPLRQISRSTANNAARTSSMMPAAGICAHFARSDGRVISRCALPRPPFVSAARSP